MSSSFGTQVRVSVFGQSHGPAVGVVVDGLPAGETVDLEQLQAFLDRRAPGRDPLATPRKEPDQVKVLSGLAQGMTCGAPFCAVIENTNTRSGDYSLLGDLPRPSHADYPAYVKHGGYNDVRGGGHFSARLTAALCIAGGVALQLLERRGILIAGHLERIGAVQDDRFDPVALEPETLHRVSTMAMPVLNAQAIPSMRAEIEAARANGDSIGGVVECAALGLPVGLGEPLFDGVENKIAQAVFAVPAVRGIEFGDGFAAAQMRGSQHNDPYRMQGGRITTRTNHHGGVLGGLASGMPLVFRAAFKPTPSIAQEQDTISLSKNENTALAVRGRHDPCVALRAVPCVEAAAAISLLDLMLMGGYQGRNSK